MQEQIYVLDGIIPQSYSNYLKLVLFSSNIWGVGKNINSTSPHQPELYENIIDRVYDKGQLSCNMFSKGHIQHTLFHQVNPILHYLQQQFNYSYSYEILRIKANLKHSVSSEYRGMYNPPHIDILNAPPNSFTVLYYINDSDGDTIIFDEWDSPSIHNSTKKLDFPIIETVPPKQGKIVVFPTQQFHSANFPIDSPLRGIINFNILITPFE
jgi:hypothetical protein